jgi:hypothetical protein
MSGYSNTSSAVIMRPCGMVTPSALAVFTLTLQQIIDSAIRQADAEARACDSFIARQDEVLQRSASERNLVFKVCDNAKVEPTPQSQVEPVAEQQALDVMNEELETLTRAFEQICDRVAALRDRVATLEERNTNNVTPLRGRDVA